MGKRKWVAGMLYTIVIAQFATSISTLAYAAETPGQYLYTIKHALGFLKERF
jgi:hypothetical protein